MLRTLPPSQAELIRQYLRSVDYTDDAFRKRTNLRDLPSRRAGNLPFLLECTSEQNPFNLLLRLFLFGVPVPRSAVASHLPAELTGALEGAGALRPDGENWLATVMLAPLDRYWFAADPVRRMETAGAADLVLWANPTTRMLSQFAVRRPSRETLDLGSGCGVLSVLAASFSERVTATDLNPRAERFAVFNASLNGVSNLECRTGDTYETVRDRRFDLILANPPFFITPSSGTLYCENPMELDGYCRRVVREGALLLNDGGYLQMTFEWVRVRGQSWQERLDEWLEGSGCDAWIVRTYSGDPAGYAYERTRDQSAADPDAGAARFEALVRYYRDRQVEEICGGMLAARRRSGGNWLRIEEARLEPGEPFGEDVEALFATQTVLSSATPADLVRARPRLAEGVRLQQEMRPEAGRWSAGPSTLKRERGIPSSISVERAVAEFAVRCDGIKSVEQLAAELAVSVKAPHAQVVEQCCAVVRKLAERQLLVLNGAV